MKTDVFHVSEPGPGVFDHVLRNVDSGPVPASGRQFQTDAADPAAQFEYAVPFRDIQGRADLLRRPATRVPQDLLVAAAVHRGHRRFGRHRPQVPGFLV